MRVGQVECGVGLEVFTIPNEITLTLMCGIDETKMKKTLVRASEESHK